MLLQSDCAPDAPLYLDSSQIRRLTKLEPSLISITHKFQPARLKVERFMEERYAEAYGTRLAGHYPTLMSVHDGAGAILAAVGFRSAGEEPLFLEQYLDTPIEAALVAHGLAGVDRGAIVEIGSLTSNGRGASIFLFIVLAAYLRQRGFSIACATATGVLRRTFGMLGLAVVDLAPARAEKLSDNAASWGSYYETDPRVIAGTISDCFETLERFVPADRNPEFGRLFPRLHYRSAS
ncbi:MAG: thermostable hemolysin [Rhodospirillaceae bacterium]